MDYAGEVTLPLQTTAASPLRSSLLRYRSVDKRAFVELSSRNLCLVMTQTVDSPGSASTSLAAAVFTQRRHLGRVLRGVSSGDL